MPSPRTTVAHTNSPEPPLDALGTMLHREAVKEWEECSTDPSTVDEWLRDNILHAFASCPSVIAYWKHGHRHGHSDKLSDIVLSRYIAVALESVDDETKTRILSGRYANTAHVSLGRFIKERPASWNSLSPLWVGAPGSELRAAAVERGWSMACLPAQVNQSLARPHAQQWSAWVTYPHALATMHLGARLEWAKSNNTVLGARSGVVQNTGQAWARPEDMALSHALAKHLVLEEGMYTMVAHPQAQPVSPELQEHMNGLVDVYVGLGALETLKKTIVEGILPRVEHHARVELPELGLSGMEAA